jgi:hypothetical protein
MVYKCWKKALIVAIMVLSINLWIYETLRMLIGHEKPTNILKSFSSTQLQIITSFPREIK